MSDRIDVNAASGDELSEILEVDGEVADRIIEYRARHGGFRSLDELRGIPGIEGDVLDHLGERLIIGVPTGAPLTP